MSRSLDAASNKIWITCRLFTVQADTEWGVIVRTAPIAKKFIGQPIGNLIRWAEKFGGARWEII